MYTSMYVHVLVSYSTDKIEKEFILGKGKPPQEKEWGGLIFSFDFLGALDDRLHISSDGALAKGTAVVKS